MKAFRLGERIWTVIVVGVLVSVPVLLTGCASSKSRSHHAKEPLSLRGTGRECGRGVVNVAFCWLEIPDDIEHQVRSNYDPSLGGVVGTSVDIVEGAVSGTFGTVERAMTGVFEIVLCPFPPYGPMAKPGLPPYLQRVTEISPEEVEAGDVIVEE